tara:strand:+ start:112 stop:480 length:369 start_codon:yes stop_codon:yes gene_type:complete
MEEEQSNVEENTAGIAPEVAGLGKEERARLRGIREILEPHVANFDGREMWYQERLLQFTGTAHITTDEWGVRVRFESENFRTVTLSGRWDIISAHANGLSAQYCDWRLCFDCPWPELGTSYG